MDRASRWAVESSDVSEGEREDNSLTITAPYSARVAELMRFFRASTRMSKAAFARLIAAELGKEAHTVPQHHVTHWERGDRLPYSDTFLAAMTIAGVDPTRLEDRRRLLSTVLRDFRSEDPRLLELRPALEDASAYVSIQATGKLLGLSRPAIYTLRDRGELIFYRWSEQPGFPPRSTVVRRADVEALADRRRT